MIRFAFGAVIFDMDGLMFDTERIAVQSWVRAAHESGFEFPASLQSSLAGRDKEGGRKVILEALGADFPYDTVREKRLRYFKESIQTYGVPLKKGLHGLLAFFQGRSIPMAVATSTDRPRASFLLERAGVASCFHTIVCGDEVTRCKPDPEIYYVAARSLGFPPADCLVLEDSCVGIAAAHAAGALAVMIPDLIQPDAAALQRIWKRFDSLEDLHGFLATNRVH